MIFKNRAVRTVFFIKKHMIRIGDFNTLKAVRSTSVGIFLSDDEGTEILLPNKYVPKDIVLNESLKVFCYLDHEERPVATTLRPLVARDEFAFLKVAQTNKIGAFLDWGLEKQLFVPFKEQKVRMEEGKSYVIHCFLDELSFRLMASAKIDKFIQSEQSSYNENDKVELLVSRKTNLGWEVVINNAHKGLLFFNDVFKDVKIGDKHIGYIKNVRKDGKIDVTLSPTGIEVLDVSANHLLQTLEANGGFLPLNDTSAPQEIRDTLQMSKKSFKKGVGVLYKARKIELLDSGIRLKD